MRGIDHILVHIGFPKTATTWLQEYVFSNSELGFTSPWGTRSGLAIDQFVLSSPFYFDPQNAFNVFLETAGDALASGLVPVLSEETLVGDPTSGKYWGKTAADKISQTFPTAKIVISIREQRSFILSAYKEYVLAGGTVSIDRFLGLGDAVLRPGFEGICQRNSLEYDRVISYYQSLFGKQNVIVLAYEELRSNPDRYLGRLFRFAGVETSSSPLTDKRTHVGQKGLTLRIRRFGNRYVQQQDVLMNKRPISWRILGRLCALTDSDGLIPSKIHSAYDSRVVDRINLLVGGYFFESNHRSNALLEDMQLPEEYFA